MSEYSPGPYRLGDRATTIYGAPTTDGSMPEVIATLAMTPNRRANGDLLSAAPELLEKGDDLQKLFPEMDDWNVSPHTEISFKWHEIASIIFEFRNAINKAKRRQ